MGKINKFLCSRFDFEDKGYVTIGDFIKGIIYTIIVVSMIVIIIYSVFEFISRGIIYNNGELLQRVSFYYLGGTITILIVALTIILIIVTIVTLIQIVLDVKIAECTVKNKIEHEIRPDSFIATYSEGKLNLKKKET